MSSNLKFTLQHFLETIDDFLKEESSPDAYQKLLELFLEDFAPTFRHQVASGVISVPDSRGHTFNVATELAEIAKGQVPKYGKFFQIEHSLAHAILFSTAYGVSKAFSEETAKLVYSQLSRYLQTLTIEPDFTAEFWRLWGQTDAECSACGTRISVWFFGKRSLANKITIEYTWFDHSKFSLEPGGKREDPHVAVPLCEYDSSKTWETLVEFKDSTVYAADWFRLPGFTKYVDNNAPNNSLNTVLGCVKETLRYAQDHNFVKLQVGNCSPRVFTATDKIVIGREIDELDETCTGPTFKEIGLKDKGFVCTDLWAACLIDKQTLTHILLKINPDLDVKKTLEEWLKSEHVVKIKVTPGKYRVYFDGYGHMFDAKYQQHFNVKNVKLMGFLEKID